jgi:hypothetical protein
MMILCVTDPNARACPVGLSLEQGLRWSDISVAARCQMPCDVWYVEFYELGMLSKVMVKWHVSWQHITNENEDSKM